jgi:putative membrane protein
MRNKLFTTTTLSAVLLAAGMGLAMAQGAGGGVFITEAIQGNLAEVEMGKLAQQKGDTDAVRSFGQTLVSDHSAANDKAMDAAKELGVNPPDQPNGKQKKSYEKLSKLSGSAFDRQFKHMMVMDHKEDIQKFQKEANRRGDDAAVQYAKETLPTLKKHLELAQALSVKEGSASSR